MATYIKRLGIIQKLKQEQKEIKEMLDDAFESNDEFREAKANKGEVTKDYSVIKAQIINEPANAKLADKLKEIGAELSEEKDLFAQELAVYFSKEGKSEIKLADGTVIKFKLAATFTERVE